jgi:hypothetical protein
MNTTLSKIAAILAFAIGLMAVFSGGKTLLGNLPDYYVINWLPLYNYTMGVLTAFVTVPLIWINSKVTLPVAITTFILHALVMFILQVAYADVVARESVVAMSIRLGTWFVILALTIIKMKKQKRIFAGA